MLRSLKQPGMDEYVALAAAKAAEARAAASAAGDKKGAGAAAATPASTGKAAAPDAKTAKMMAMAAAMGMVPVGDGEAKTEKKGHAFWSTQPVPQAPILASSSAAAAGGSGQGAGSGSGSGSGAGSAASSSIASIMAASASASSSAPSSSSSSSTHGPLESRTLDDVRKEPLNLPNGFEWCAIDVKDPAQMKEMYDLLAENYVEDDDNMFRFAYSVDFLTWALTPPDYFPEWHVGVRVQNKGRALVACITGIPADMSVYDTHVRMCEINFLCVAKKLRSKRLAPVLIKEVTRRVNLRGIWQATYTAGVVIPTPVASCL
jgi:hypothetical protein